MIPPPERAKQKILAEYCRMFGRRIFIETGTFRGDMVAAMRPFFDRLITIELSETLCAAVSARFSKDQNIITLCGDSALELPRLLKTLNEPAMFWLDAHYSRGLTARGPKETTISEELTAILGHRVQNHIILIDDARCFDGTRDYPKLEELLGDIRAQAPHYHALVLNDIIRLTPFQYHAKI